MSYLKCTCTFVVVGLDIFLKRNLWIKSTGISGQLDMVHKMYKLLDLSNMHKMYRCMIVYNVGTEGSANASFKNLNIDSFIVRNWGIAYL